MRYINRKGETIDKEEWDKLRADESYYIVHRFDNDKVKLIIEWIGRLDDRQVESLYEDMYPLFRVSLYNYDGTGVARQDPVNHGDTFSNEEDCNEFYQEFLIRWAGAEKKEVLDKKSGLWREKLIVQGNKFGEPGDDGSDLAAPKTEDDDDEVGGW